MGDARKTSATIVAEIPPFASCTRSTPLSGRQPSDNEESMMARDQLPSSTVATANAHYRQTTEIGREVPRN